MTDLAVVVGCLALSGAAAFAAAVAVVEADRALGVAACTAAALMIGDAWELGDWSLPVLGNAGWLVACVTVVVVLTVALTWSPSNTDRAARIALAGLVASLVLALPGSYPMVASLAVLAKLVGVVAWSCALGVRGYSIATRGIPVPHR